MKFKLVVGGLVAGLVLVLAGLCVLIYFLVKWLV